LKKETHRSLSTIQRLCNRYNHPERSFKTVHVAGTNGKGSVCTKIATVLTLQGYRCGLYTSPHLSTFRERIRIDGQMISEEEIADLFSQIPVDTSATFFEFATLLAFLYFQQKKVDVAVIETGMGGRWDATNVVLPLVSIITSIGFDHTDILGKTLEEIAYEKAGIIKENVPVVIGSDTPFSFLEKIAKERNAPLFHHQKTFTNYDLENQETARLALELLASHFPISSQALQKGLLAKPACRFEQVTKNKPVILDVAHNPHGFTRLIQALRAHYPQHNYRFVVGFSKDKEISECAHLIESAGIAVHLVSGAHPRLASIHELQALFRAKGTLEPSIAQGIAHALLAPSDTPEVVVISGSFFIMAEARNALGIEEAKDPNILYDSSLIEKKDA